MTTKKRPRDFAECKADTVTLGSGDGELVVCSDGKVFLGGKLAAADVAYRSIAQTLTDREGEFVRSCHGGMYRATFAGAAVAAAVFFVGFLARAIVYAARAKFEGRRARRIEAQRQEALDELKGGPRVG